MDPLVIAAILAIGLVLFMFVFFWRTEPQGKDPRTRE